MLAKELTIKIHPLAGTPAKPDDLVNVSELVTAYYTNQPDPTIPVERVAFGTSGHRGSSFDTAFNEDHILAITQAICLYRKHQKISGPLFFGSDTHALSVPATATALEVLAANEVRVMLAKDGEYTPTPAVSHAILKYNKDRNLSLADGIVMTPSHNPPRDGGFKYNPPTGGPADENTTKWIEAKANEYLETGLKGIKRVPYQRALRASTTHSYDYLSSYIDDLENVIDMEMIKQSGVSLGVDPLGGAGVHYWGRIADKYGLNLTVVSEVVDPTFRFMTLDWDGQIRMDPSSPYAMQRLIGLKEKFDISCACDTDHDRHGIVTKKAGLLPPNHFLVAAIWYLFKNRSGWGENLSIGKTVVSSQLIDRIGKALKREVCNVPVGFKWFVNGLLDGSLGFAGEESAGAAFARLTGKVWTTDKDGITLALLAAEMTAKMQEDPGEIYEKLSSRYGKPYYKRIEVAATPEQKKLLSQLSSNNVNSVELAGEKVTDIFSSAANGASIGGVKVVTENGWFVARPSGTENIYKIYAESFLDSGHLDCVLDQAQGIVNKALKAL